jgi:hypothetical protein
MITVLPIFGLVLVGGCNHAAPGGDKAQAAAAPAGPHSNAAPGTYTHTDAKGSMITTFMADDKSYTDWVAGAMTERGKWAVENNKTCYTPDKGDKHCTSDGPIGPDGTYTATPDQGEPYTVTKT